MSYELLKSVRVGDRVTIFTPQGQERSGRAVIIEATPGVVVLNGGGRYGTPICATARNILKVKPAKRAKGAA